MSEKPKNFPPIYNAENAKNPKEGSDWLGGPQNGNETPGKQTEGAYQTASHSTGYTDQLGSADWLGGPQNGNETPSQGVDGSGRTWSGRGKPSEAAPSITSQAGRVGTGNISGVDTQTGSQAKGMGSDGYTKHRFNETPGEASKQAPDRSGSQAYTDKLGGSSDN